MKNIFFIYLFIFFFILYINKNCYSQTNNPTFPTPPPLPPPPPSPPQSSSSSSSGNTPQSAPPIPKPISDKVETYWISPKYGVESIGCGLLKQFPCKNIGDIIPNRITPNVTTVINLMEGVYKGNFSYLLTNYIILFKGEGRDKTIIDLQWKERFALCTISDFHFKDLTIKNGFGNPISGIFDGGAIYAYDSQVHLVNVAFVDNTCAATGGGIFLYNCYFNVEDSLFRNNSATSGGGFILLLSASNITNSIFTQNRVFQEGKGGAIQVFISFVRIELSLFTYNVSPYSGAIDMVGGNLSAIYTQFIENHSNIGGGFGLYFISNVVFQSCEFISNTANSTGGLAFLTAQSQLRFSLCIFRDNYAPNCGIVESHSISPLLFESCSFSGDVPTAVQIALYDNYCFLKVQNCHFSGMEGVLMYADSISNIIIDSSSFTNVSNRIIDVGNEADILIISSTFYNITIDEYLVSLSNGNFLAYNMDFRNNIVLALIKSSVGGSVTMVSSNMINNVVSIALISLKNSYNIYIENCEVKNNTGLFKGCFIDADHTGKEIIVQSLFENNRSPFGPILYFSNPEIAIPNNYSSTFQDIVFINNKAAFAGALVYFSQNVSLPNITCIDCIYENNTAVFGELVNSAFYNFNVSIPSVIYPFQDITIVITALDYFGNLVRGTSDLGFFAIPCSDAFVEGNLFAVLNENGTAIFTNIKLSSNPNSVCNLTFLSVPIISEGGPVTIPTSFSYCPSNRELVMIKSIYYCLKTIKVSTFVKGLIGILALLLVAGLVFSGVISLKYRKKRVIRYSNPLFLSIILVGCIIFLITIPVLFDTTEATCKLRFPIIVIGSCLITSSVFIKQFRIWRLIKDIQLLRETNVENKYLLKFISILMVVPIIIVACSFFLYPTHEKYSFNQKDITITHYCSNGMYLSYVIIFLVYQMAILLFGCYLVIVCRKFRSIPGTFNEATYIGILIYNYTVVLIVAIPLAYVFSKNPLANFLIFSISILMFVASTIVLLFIPKFHFLLRKRAIISSLEKLIKEQEVIVQRNKDILYFYDMYLAEERTGNQNNNIGSNTFASGGGRGSGNTHYRTNSKRRSTTTAMTGLSTDSDHNPNLTSFTSSTSSPASNISSNISDSDATPDFNDPNFLTYYHNRVNNYNNNNNNNNNNNKSNQSKRKSSTSNSNNKNKNKTPTTENQTDKSPKSSSNSKSSTPTTSSSNRSSPNMAIPINSTRIPTPPPPQYSPKSPTSPKSNKSSTTISHTSPKSNKSSTTASPKSILSNRSIKSPINNNNNNITTSGGSSRRGSTSSTNSLASNSSDNSEQYNQKVINRIFNIHHDKRKEFKESDENILTSSIDSNDSPDFNENLNNNQTTTTTTTTIKSTTPSDSDESPDFNTNINNNNNNISPINISNNNNNNNLPPINLSSNTNNNKNQNKRKK